MLLQARHDKRADIFPHFLAVFVNFLGYKNKMVWKP